MFYLNQIRKAADFWEWTNDIFIPAMFPSNESLPLIDDDRILTDGVMFLTGPVRIRQLRLDPDGKYYWCFCKKTE